MWKAIEIHTHTNHTDGEFSPEDLVRYSKSCEYDGILLSDHNTISAAPEFELALEIYNAVGFAGIELTTFYGHMLVYGNEKDIDWRFIGKHDMDKAIEQIKKYKGIVGIAHPFALGSPINTGYTWEFEIEKWENVDFIELWSRIKPCEKVQTKKAFELWESLLKKGYKISGTSGRDWHRYEKGLSVTFTYSDLPDKFKKEEILDSIRNGKMVSTAGPLLTMYVNDNIKSSIGDEISSGKYDLVISVDDSKRCSQWDKNHIQGKTVVLICNGDVIYTEPVNEKMVVENIHLPPGYIRAELYGRYFEHENTRIAFTNPIYIK